MTILECLDKFGYYVIGDFDIPFDVPDYCWADVRVGFINSDGNGDQTSFGIENPMLDSGCQDLAELFDEFCAENDFPNDTVTYIEINCVAPTYDELVRLTH